MVHVAVQKTGGGASANGDGKVSKNGDGSVTYQDPLDMYCEDNPETDECRYVLPLHTAFASMCRHSQSVGQILGLCEQQPETDQSN